MYTILIVILLFLMAGLAYSLYQFYLARSFRVMGSFAVLGFVLAYYFKGLTEAKLALGGGIGTEGLFVAVTVMILMLFNGVLGQFLSIALKKPLSKGLKIGLSIGVLFIIISSLRLLLTLL